MMNFSNTTQIEQQLQSDANENTIHRMTELLAEYYNLATSIGMDVEQVGKAITLDLDSNCINGVLDTFEFQKGVNKAIDVIWAVEEDEE